MVKWFSVFSISGRKYIWNIRLPTYLTELRRVVHNLNSCQLHKKIMSFPNFSAKTKVHAIRYAF